jgi:hypothetical protein
MPAGKLTEGRRHTWEPRCREEPSGEWEMELSRCCTGSPGFAELDSIAEPWGWRLGSGEHLPSKCEALSSNPNTVKKKKQPRSLGVCRGQGSGERGKGCSSHLADTALPLGKVCRLWSLEHRSPLQRHREERSAVEGLQGRPSKITSPILTAALL